MSDLNRRQGSLAGLAQRLLSSFSKAGPRESERKSFLSSSVGTNCLTLKILLWLLTALFIRKESSKNPANSSLLVGYSQFHRGLNCVLSGKLLKHGFCMEDCKGWAKIARSCSGPITIPLLS